MLAESSVSQTDCVTKWVFSNQRLCEGHDAESGSNRCVAASEKRRWKVSNALWKENAERSADGAESRAGLRVAAWPATRQSSQQMRELHDIGAALCSCNCSTSSHRQQVSSCASDARHSATPTQLYCYLTGCYDDKVMERFHSLERQ